MADEYNRCIGLDGEEKRYLIRVNHLEKLFKQLSQKIRSHQLQNNMYNRKNLENLRTQIIYLRRQLIYNVGSIDIKLKIHFKNRLNTLLRKINMLL